MNVKCNTIHHKIIEKGGGSVRILTSHLFLDTCSLFLAAISKKKIDPGFSHSDRIRRRSWLNLAKPYSSPPSLLPSYLLIFLFSYLLTFYFQLVTCSFFLFPCFMYIPLYEKNDTEYHFHRFKKLRQGKQNSNYS